MSFCLKNFHILAFNNNNHWHQMNRNHLQKYYPSLCHLNFYRVTKLSRLYQAALHHCENTLKLQPCLQHVQKTVYMNSLLLLFIAFPQHTLSSTQPLKFLFLQGWDLYNSSAFFLKSFGSQRDKGWLWSQMHSFKISISHCS